MIKKIESGLTGFFNINEQETISGKDIGILKDYYTFDSYPLINNEILCQTLFCKNLKKDFKLIDIYNYIHRLSKLLHEHTIYELVHDISINFGVPKKFIKKENNKYFIDNKYFDYCSKCFSIINELNTLEQNQKIDKINKLNINFPVTFTIVENQTLLSNHKLIPTSTSIFNLFFYTLLLISSSDETLIKPFICSECGLTFERITNNQKYCDNCRSKIDFPKISHKKNY